MIMSAHSPNQFYDKLRTLVQIYRTVHMGTPAVDGSHTGRLVLVSPPVWMKHMVWRWLQVSRNQGRPNEPCQEEVEKRTTGTSHTTHPLWSGNNSTLLLDNCSQLICLSNNPFDSICDHHSAGLSEQNILLPSKSISTDKAHFNKTTHSLVENNYCTS